MFVDASAIVAILTREPDADALIERLERAIRPITSAVAIFEAALGLCRKRHASVEEARADIADFIKAARIELVAIAANEASIALSAFAWYGKGRGHPAPFNMGDCFAYAVAGNHRITLLFKGGDFSKTDIVTAREDPGRRTLQAKSSAPRRGPGRPRHLSRQVWAGWPGPAPPTYKGTVQPETGTVLLWRTFRDARAARAPS